MRNNNRIPGPSIAKQIHTKISMTLEALGDRTDDDVSRNSDYGPGSGTSRSAKGFHWLLAHYVREEPVKQHSKARYLLGE